MLGSVLVVCYSWGNDAAENSFFEGIHRSVLVVVDMGTTRVLDMIDSCLQVFLLYGVIF